MKKLSICVTLAWLAGSAWSQSVSFGPVSTVEGCSIQVPQPRPQMFASVDAQGRALPVRETYSWSGACAAGTAFGPGRLSYEWRSGDAFMKTVNVMTVNAGFRFGFEYTWSEASLSGRTVPEVYFWHNNRVVSFSEGMGLDTSAFANGVSRVVEPRTVPLRVSDSYQGMNAPSGRVSVVNIPNFSIDARGNSQSVNNFGLMGRAPGLSGRTPCPVPTDANSCIAMLEQIGGPLREEILSFIRQAKPEVDAQYERVAQALGRGPATSGPAATAAPAPAAASGGAAQGTSPASGGGSGTGNAAFNTLPVGALFAAGDEAAARGDRATAREAFRALIRRFPDHPLAATAARQLSSLQGQ